MCVNCIVKTQAADKIRSNSSFVCRQVLFYILLFSFYYHRLSGNKQTIFSSLSFDLTTFCLFLLESTNVLCVRKQSLFFSNKQNEECKSKPEVRSFYTHNRNKNKQQLIKLMATNLSSTKLCFCLQFSFFFPLMF